VNHLAPLVPILRALSAQLFRLASPNAAGIGGMT
jgi:hypothetical protein